MDIRRWRHCRTCEVMWVNALTCWLCGRFGAKSDRPQFRGHMETGVAA